jgi:hypothetical protein
MTALAWSARVVRALVARRETKSGAVDVRAVVQTGAPAPCHGDELAIRATAAVCLHLQLEAERRSSRNVSSTAAQTSAIARPARVRLTLAGHHETRPARDRRDESRRSRCAARALVSRLEALDAQPLARVLRSRQDGRGGPGVAVLLRGRSSHSRPRSRLAGPRPLRSSLAHDARVHLVVDPEECRDAGHVREASRGRRSPTRSPVRSQRSRPAHRPCGPAARAGNPPAPAAAPPVQPLVPATRRGGGQPGGSTPPLTRGPRAATHGGKSPGWGP